MKEDARYLATLVRAEAHIDYIKDSIIGLSNLDLGDDALNDDKNMFCERSMGDLERIEAFMDREGERRYADIGGDE